jgi:hypothetical protein
MHLNCCLFDVSSSAATLQSIKSEAERQSSLRSEAENKLKEAEASIRSMQAKSKQLIGAMQNQLEEQTNARVNTQLQTALVKDIYLSM